LRLAGEIPHPSGEAVGVHETSRRLGRLDRECRDDHIEIMGRIPVNPVTVRVRSTVHGEFSRREIDVFYLGILVVEDRQEFILEILLAEQEENKPRPFIDRIVDVDRCSGIIELDRYRLHLDVPVSILICSHGRRYAQEHNKNKNADCTGPHKHTSFANRA